jgi:hypothetical protein
LGPSDEQLQLWSTTWELTEPDVQQNMCDALVGASDSVVDSFAEQFAAEGVDDSREYLDWVRVFRC